MSSGFVVTYYCSIMAVTVYYLAVSFSSELPWATCSPAWPHCFDARAGLSGGFSPAFSNLSAVRHSSSELYFK